MSGNDHVSLKLGTRSYPGVTILWTLFVSTSSRNVSFSNLASKSTKIAKKIFFESLLIPCQKGHTVGQNGRDRTGLQATFQKFAVLQLDSFFWHMLLSRDSVTKSDLMKWGEQSLKFFVGAKSVFFGSVVFLFKFLSSGNLWTETHTFGYLAIISHMTIWGRTLENYIGTTQIGLLRIQKPTKCRC